MPFNLYDRRYLATNEKYINFTLVMMRKGKQRALVGTYVNVERRIYIHVTK